MNISKIEVIHREPQQQQGEGLQQQRPTSSTSKSTTTATMASSSTNTNASSSSSNKAAAAAAAETAKPLTTKEKEILFQIPGNSRCCDCDQSKPEWASLTLGTVICLECSGQHRGLGTHISFVRSIVMDSWTPKQLQRMKLGGNMSCQEFMKSHKHQIMENLSNTNENEKILTIRQKYDTQVGDLYSLVLTAKLEGGPIPTELPPKRIPKIRPAGKQMSGFGSTAHPREIRKQKRKKIAVVGSAIVSVAAVAWGLSRVGRGGGGKASTTNATTSPSATARP